MRENIKNEKMTPKERDNATFTGEPVDRFPVTAVYSHLYYRDHFSELSGLPQWKIYEWVRSDPEKYFSTFHKIWKNAPFEFIQPYPCVTREERENTEFVEKDGRMFYHDKKNDVYEPLVMKAGKHSEWATNETQIVFDKKDINEKVEIVPAEVQIKQGLNDYLDLLIARMGRENFILSGGIIGTFYLCHTFFGLTNLFMQIYDHPELVKYLSQKLLESNIERIRRLTVAGGNIIFIDDAMSTSDCISVQHYEEFSLPYIRAMVDEIHRHNHKVFLIYFGGVEDRLELIGETGADGLCVECKMKNYTNDIAEIVEKLGDKMTIFSNIDPISMLDGADDETLEKEIIRQVKAGRKARGFVLSPASPILPVTPLTRVHKFIELGKKHGIPETIRSSNKWI